MAVKELGSHTEPSNLDLFVSPKRLFEPFRSRTCGWVRPMSWARTHCMDWRQGGGGTRSGLEIVLNTLEIGSGYEEICVGMFSWDFDDSGGRIGGVYCAEASTLFPNFG